MPGFTLVIRQDSSSERPMAPPRLKRHSARARRCPTRVFNYVTPVHFGDRRPLGMVFPCGRLLSTAFLFWLVVRRGAILHPKLLGAAIGGLACLGLECSRNELLKLERISHSGVALGSGPAHLGSGAIRRWRGIRPAVARAQGILEVTSLSVKDFRDFRLSRGRRRGDYRSGRKKQHGAA
jgi:hypothetical protein